MRKLVIVLVILVLIIGGIKLVDTFLAKQGPHRGQSRTRPCAPDATPRASLPPMRTTSPTWITASPRIAEAVRASLDPYVPGHPGGGCGHSAR